jgi:hypothetical protein
LERRTLLSHAPGEHIHPILQIFIEGQQVTIPGDIGLTATRHFNPHTHDTIGTLHVGEGPISGIDPFGSPLRFTTLDDFFDVWRTTGTSGTPQNNPNAFFSSSQLMDRIEDATHVVRMTVDGVPSTEYQNYSPHDADQIVLSFEAIQNHAPIASPQNANVALNTAESITLSGDDNDPEVTQTLSFRVQSLPANGTLRDSNGNVVTIGATLPSATLTFTPNTNFAGNTNFTFDIEDNGGTAGGGQNTSTVATVSLAVATNLRPTANPQNVTVPLGTNKTITLTGDDGDPDAAQTLTFQIQTLPAGGTLRDSNGAVVTAGTTLPSATVTYTPNASTVGPDPFAFIVQDNGGTENGGQNTSNPATVSILVTPNHTPIANAQTVTVQPGASRTITLTGDDGDGDLVQAISFRVQSRPANGTLIDSAGNAVVVGAVLPSPTVTYTPAAGSTGADSFRFDVRDDGGTLGGLSDTSSLATVTINVNAAGNGQGGSVKLHGDGRLVVQCGAEDNTVLVAPDAAGDIEVIVDGESQLFDRSSVEMLVVRTGGGDDTVTIDPDVDSDLPARVRTGRGDDEVELGSGDSTVRAGKGDDVIIGGDGADELHGGRGADEISGGAGDDKLYGDPRGARHRNGGPNNNENAADVPRHAADGHANDGHDETGANGDDILEGGAGNDIIFGGYGHDRLMGDTGDDTIRGGRGEDEIDGGLGADLIRGGRGHDEDMDNDPLDHSMGMES